MNKDEVMRVVTQKYLDGLDKDNIPSNSQIAKELIERVREEFSLENALRVKGEKWLIPQQLTNAQIALIVRFKYSIVKIACGGREKTSEGQELLGVYQTHGPDEGLYTTSNDDFWKIMKGFNFNLSIKAFEEIMVIIKKESPLVEPCNDQDLIAVNNGIFNYKTKVIMPFSPDYVFLSKSKVNYNPRAQNHVLHNPDDNMDWDVESWMNELSDDPEIVNLFWEILGAILRPDVSWNKSVWFYANTGNNGKGTLCELMRNLCGPGTYASIPLNQLGQNFGLEALIGASAIIVDENDVGAYVDSAANLKAIITHDVIQINRKFKTAVAYKCKGLMVQCVNEFPRVKDKSGSLYRRQLLVPFTKCFTGCERKYIKNDYLHRAEVLEYVLYKVLNMNYYTLSEPMACTQLLEEYKTYNDPLRQFVEDVFPKLVWDLQPFTFLYELYKAWYRKNSPSGTPLGRNAFIESLISLLPTLPEWECENKKKSISTGNKMDLPEPLIIEFDIREWMNPNYKGNDKDLICHPDLKKNYRGLERKAAYWGSANKAAKVESK